MIAISANRVRLCSAIEENAIHSRVIELNRTFDFQPFDSCKIGTQKKWQILKGSSTSEYAQDYSTRFL